MVFQILRKKSRRIGDMRRASFSFYRQGLFGSRSEPGAAALGVKSHSLFPSAEGDVKAHSQTAGFSRSRRPRTVQVRGFFKPRWSTY